MNTPSSSHKSLTTKPLGLWPLPMSLAHSNLQEQPTLLLRDEVATRGSWRQGQGLRLDVEGDGQEVAALPVEVPSFGLAQGVAGGSLAWLASRGHGWAYAAPRVT